MNKKYRHLLLILFWPFFLYAFFATEKLALTTGYTVIHCSLDDVIPFCEYWIIPYVIWYPFWILMLFYSAFWEVPVFVRFMKYLMITLLISLVIYVVWPTGHHLRPESFPRDNFFSWLTGLIYKADNCTNICPSEHVQTAFGVVFAALDSKRLSVKKPWMIFFWTEAILVAFSVVFIKQHSAVDVFAAIPVILIGYFLTYYKKAAHG